MASGDRQWFHSEGAAAELSRWQVTPDGRKLKEKEKKQKEKRRRRESRAAALSVTSAELKNPSHLQTRKGVRAAARVSILQHRNSHLAGCDKTQETSQGSRCSQEQEHF